ncbi:hypothetical protein [Kordiimonas pumila]|uniref:Uncharacterized protein n=1 Tax=Kordiimonas pumila TaxID=2161677 RepID=A0ABV7D410_9PROT|nr:hypothetical protein [Kordiimonas pumila]
MRHIVYAITFSFLFCFQLHAQETPALDKALEEIGAPQSTVNKVKHLDKFLFSQDQATFSGLAQRSPYDQYGGRQRLAFAGNISSNERFLTTIVDDLGKELFPQQIIMDAPQTDADILVVGVFDIANSETPEFKQKYRSFTEVRESQEQDSFTTSDNTCRVIRTRSDNTIIRTLIIALRDNLNHLTGRKQSSIGSCINRGHYYHFGYSNVAKYGRKQFAVNALGSPHIAMAKEYQPPFSTLLTNGQYIGATRLELLKAIAQTEFKSETPSAIQAVDDQAEGRDYRGTTLGDTRIKGPNETTREYDRWAFKKGQDRLISRNNNITQSYYTGTLNHNNDLIAFNHTYLSAVTFSGNLLEAGIAEVADLMIIGLGDISEFDTAPFREKYAPFFPSKYQQDEIRPVSLDGKCVLIRARKVNTVISTIVGVETNLHKETKNSGLTPDKVIDCINRGHYFHYGFSNIGYQAANTFGTFRIDTDLPFNDGRGYTLPSDIKVTPPRLMADRKTAGSKRKNVLIAYRNEIWPEGKNKFTTINGNTVNTFTVEKITPPSRSHYPESPEVKEAKLAYHAAINELMEFARQKKALIAANPSAYDPEARSQAYLDLEREAQEMYKKVEGLEAIYKALSRAQMEGKK